MKTKLQIETAEQILNKALNTKKKEITNKIIQKETKKYTNKIKTLFNKSYTLNTEIKKLADEIEKDNKFYLSTANLHNTHKKPTEEDITQTIQLKYPYNLTKDLLLKETEEVENFILGLKLGTSLLEDLQELLNKIKNI